MTTGRKQVSAVVRTQFDEELARSGFAERVSEYLEVSGIGRRMADGLSQHAGPAFDLQNVEEGEDEPLAPVTVLQSDFDRRIVEEELLEATSSRFRTEHYADAVGAGVIALCNTIRAKSNRTEDGDALMTVVFSPNNPILRINKGKTKNDESEQRGHMFLCQGVVGAWRNPRAHLLVDDKPERCLMMLETIQDLMRVTQQATKTRKPKKP